MLSHFVLPSVPLIHHWIWYIGCLRIFSSSWMKGCKGWDALHQENTRDLGPLPPGKLIVAFAWYIIKIQIYGSIDKKKLIARLGGQGCNQIWSWLFQTFYPVAKLSLVRLLISLAAVSCWPLYRLDIKNTFHHDDLHRIFLWSATCWLCFSGRVEVRLLSQKVFVWLEIIVRV